MANRRTAVPALGQRDVFGVRGQTKSDPALAGCGAASAPEGAVVASLCRRISGSVTLNSTTAIADGPAIGAILVLQGSPNMNPTNDSVYIPNNADTRLQNESGEFERFLGPNDTITLIWDGEDWVRIAAGEYPP